MNKFPRTLAALKEVELEQQMDCAASCSAYWAVGDALLEECGVDSTWDEVGARVSREARSSEKRNVG